MGEAVDLEEDDPGHIGVDRAAATPRLTADDVPVPGVVLVDRQQRVEDRGQGADPDRDHDPLQDPVDFGPGDQVDRDGDEDRVQQQRPEAEGEDRERQRDPGQQRPDQGVEDADRGRGAQGRGCPVEDETGEHLGEQEQGDRVEQQDEQATAENPKAHDATLRGRVVERAGAFERSNRAGRGAWS